MNLRTRLTLLSTAWLILILLMFNAFIYGFVIHLTTKSEIQLLFKKATSVSEDPKIAHAASLQDPSLLASYLVSDEMIRLIDKSGDVFNQVQSNDVLTDHKPVYRTDIHSQMISTGQNRLLYVQIPLYVNNREVATLEIGRVLNVLDEYIDVLISVLTFTTAGAVLLSLLGGYAYTSFVFRPVRQLADIMHDIQESGEFRKLAWNNREHIGEFGRLGLAFNKMIDRLEENFHRQQRFVQDASHELRTPLTIIESYASMLKRWAFNDEALRQEAVEAIHSEAVRLKGLVSGLMTMIEEQEEKRIVRKPLDMAALVRSTASAMALTFGRDIEVSIAEEELPMQGDEEKLKQLLINLLDNAIKYSRKKIRVSAERQQSDIVIRVRDQGVGIPKNRIPFIFDRLYRVDQARNRKTGGLGLGLSIAKTIVEAHGGTIDARSKSGAGTVMIVRLPVET